MNDTVNALPLPLAVAAVVLGFAALCLLADLDRTPFTTWLGQVALAVGVCCLVVAVGIAVAS